MYIVRLIFVQNTGCMGHECKSVTGLISRAYSKHLQVRYSGESLTLPCSISLSDTVLRNEAWCPATLCLANTGLVMMLPASEALQDATPSAEPCKVLSVPPYKKQNKKQWRMQHNQTFLSESGANKKTLRRKPSTWKCGKRRYLGLVYI